MLLTHFRRTADRSRPRTGSRSSKSDEGELAAAVRSASEALAQSEQPEAFLADHVVGESLLYRLLTLVFYKTAVFFHAYENDAWRQLPTGEGCLIVSLHTTHNADIFMLGTGAYSQIGRAPRGLLHRVLYLCNPWVKYIGMVPGQRYTAKHLLRNGFLVGVLPGGAEEAMAGHENAYNLHARWNTREGFAAVAKEARAKIVPIFTINAEEMRWNPFFATWNALGFPQTIFNRLVSLPFGLGWLALQLGMFVWFQLSWWAVPVPVKLKTVVGPPIDYDPDVDSPAMIAHRTRDALQAAVQSQSRLVHSHT